MDGHGGHGGGGHGGHGFRPFFNRYFYTYPVYINSGNPTGSYTVRYVANVNGFIYNDSVIIQIAESNAFGKAQDQAMIVAMAKYPNAQITISSIQQNYATQYYGTRLY